MAARVQKSHQKTHTTAARSIPPKQHSFWFRLWIGLLIGYDVFWLMADVNALTSHDPQVRALLSIPQGLLFIVLGLADIYFIIKLLYWRRFGFYGTALVTFASMIINMMLGSGIFQSVIWGIVPLIITLLFVSPNWNQYK